MTSGDPESSSATVVGGRGGLRGGRATTAVRALAPAFAVAAAALPVAALWAFRSGRLGYPLAHDVLAHRVAPALALSAVGFGLLGLVLGALARPRRGAVLPLAATAVGALVLAGGLYGRAQTAGAPPVHEVSTDWRDPPMPSARLLALRGPKANPLESAPAVPEGPTGAGFLGRPVAEVNARTCPAAAPAVLLRPPPEAYARAKAAVLAERMTLVTDDPAGLRLEATGRRGLWARVDDLMLRVRPEGAGALIDLRDSAREGLNDGGAACRRVTRLRAALGR